MTEQSAAPNSRILLATFTSLMCLVAGPSISAHGPDGYLGPRMCEFGSCDAQVHAVPPTRPPPLILAQATPNPASIGRWRLVRTSGLDGGEVVSIMHVADALKSDPDFAGLMIRCREKSVLQIALVVIRPFPPRVHPQVSISAGPMSVRFETSVIPPGSLLSLPNEAEMLARGPWQSAAQLNVEIENDGEKIRGIVTLENLSNAITYLQANCTVQ